jgi:hypothetical protein
MGIIMKNTLEEILSQYEKEQENQPRVEREVTESDYELWEYLCGNGNVIHLYNYYDLT